MKWRWWAAAGIFLIAVAACAPLRYYGQAVQGHFDLLHRRQPIAQILADPSHPPPLKHRLRYVRAAKQFAVEVLDLPDNASYEDYADLERPYVTWNVFAAPALELKPVQSCFPVVGCLAYRGYFAESDAREHAEKLRAQGHDVYVGGATAYSTLGWFDDPVVNTMFRRADFHLARILFHELAHQRWYVPDDSPFNEAFASAVEQAGVRRWLTDRGEPEILQAYQQWRTRKQAFTELVLTTTERLQALYASELSDAEKARRKSAEFAAMRARYQTLKERWHGYSGYDRWFERDLNNAKLLTVHTYQALVPGFLALLACHDGNFGALYDSVESLGQLPKDERREWLSQNEKMMDCAEIPPRNAESENRE